MASYSLKIFIEKCG